MQTASISSIYVYCFCSSITPTPQLRSDIPPVCHSLLQAFLTAASISSLSFFRSIETRSSPSAMSSSSVHLNSVPGYLTLAAAASSTNQNTRPGLGSAILAWGELVKVLCLPDGADARARQTLFWSVENVGEHVLLSLSSSDERASERVVQHRVAGISRRSKTRPARTRTHVKVIRLLGGLGLSRISATHRSPSANSSCPGNSEHV